MRVHDHAIRITGIHEGYIESELKCQHPPKDGRYYDPEYPNDCIIEEWHSELGLEMIDGASYINVYGEVPLWTVHKEWADEPVLLGRDQYIHHVEVYGPESEPRT